MIEWYWLIPAFGFGVVLAAWLRDQLGKERCDCVDCTMQRMEGYEQ